MTRKKKWSEKSDDRSDRKRGIKENSKRDRALDKKRGLKSDSKKVRRMKPKGKRGLAAVKRLGRNYKTGVFNGIVRNAESEGKSETVAKKIAGRVYWNKTKKRLGLK